MTRTNPAAVINTNRSRECPVSDQSSTIQIKAKREIHVAAVEIDRTRSLNDAAPIDCTGGQHMKCAAAVRDRACAGEIECRTIAGPHQTVVGEGAAPVEVQCLARDVGLDDAGYAVDDAQAVVANLACAAQNVVG